MSEKVPAGVLVQLELALEFGRIDPAGTSVIIEDAAMALPAKNRGVQVRKLLRMASKKRGVR